MSSLPRLKTWFEKNCAKILREYFHFLRFKSISSEPQYAKDMAACSGWLCKYMAAKTGMDVSEIKTPSYPIVYAENKNAGPKAPTLLIYGHYDVQPVDPLELWKSDPFEPTERDGKVFARGAVDDKGQIFYAIAAMQCWHELGMQLPINVKFCIEGEEESGSLGLAKSLPQLKEKFKTDSILVIDFDQYDPTTAAVSLGARGIVTFDVVLTGSNGDLHSGSHGGLAYNPNKAMVQLLAKLFDDKGRVQVPGFYDDVLASTLEEKTSFAFRYDKDSYKKEFGITALGGESDLTLAENNWFRPTLEINGIYGGYAGAGFKTVIPAQCIAKISCRLVPNQNPKTIENSLIQFLQKHVPGSMKIEIKSHGGEPAFRSKIDAPLAKAVRIAAAEATQKECKNTLAGGSIPIIGAMMRELNAEAIGMGYGLPTDNIHAPNEHFDMHRFEKGFLTVARVVELL